MIRYLKFLFLVSNILLAQYWTPYHMQDYQRNQNIYVDYESIDAYARSQNIENLIREELTHEVIGYLPYWDMIITPT